MKTILLSFALLLTLFQTQAQSAQYTKSMKSLIGRLETAENKAENYQDIANGFGRIAEAEKSEWLPKYYAAFSLIMQAMFTSSKDQVDGILDEADKYLSTISETVKHDEVMCLQAFSRSTRINVDPMSRGMKYGMESNKFLAQAQALNPNNPRVFFLQAQSAFYTPEQFGGGKKTAKILFLKAQALFESFKPENELMPVWGKEPTLQMIAECDK